ncbi:MAG: antitoxin [Bryobacteraceae bacterium]
MRTTVTLDDDVYDAAMHLANVSGERLGRVLSKLARRGLAPPQARSPKKRSRRFPAFEVPADAPIIPASRVQLVIDDEGYV